MYFINKNLLFFLAYIFYIGVAQADVHYETTHIYYATDRALSDNSKFSDKFYGKSRAVLSFGKASISIPYSHKPGQVESKPLWSLSSKNNPDKYITLLGVEEQGRNSFIDEIKKLSTSTDSRVIVFIPGYHANFEKSSKRIAQVVYDIKSSSKLNLIPILFSWPSQGTLVGYKKDEEQIKLSEANLESLLLQLANNLNKGQLFVVAHSMGNRVAMESLRAIAGVNPEILPKFAHILSIAPDVDSNYFKSELAPMMLKNGMPVTLYASSTDEILKISAKEHHTPRLGQSGRSLTVMNGLETVDASNAHTDLLGHTYFKKGPVIADIIEILDGKAAPQMRSNLIEGDAGNGKYWMIR